MKIISQNYKSGQIKLEDVDPPALKSDGVLVQTDYSVISAGTEGMKVREGKMSLVGKAIARPDQVNAVLDAARQQGIAATLQKVLHKLDSLTPLGYSLSGTVVAVGANAKNFKVGQKVACAGAGYANHAQVNYIPKNLATPVPKNVDLKQAAFTTLGAIAMQGFRQGEMQLGEKAVVIGLGLVGQILVQILKSAGMDVVGIDINKARCKLAAECGARVAGTPDQMMEEGADVVFLTAASKTNAVLEKGLDCVRDRGTIVTIGLNKVDIPYSRAFEKEVQFRYSRSYGPGRYDPQYEEQGIDYPLPYVRWTENRNMESFLQLIAAGKIDLAPLMQATYPFDQAHTVYKRLHKGTLEGLGVLFEYKKPPAALKLVSATVVPSPQKGKINLGVIGAGNYAGSMLLPHLKSNRHVHLMSVATTRPLTATNARKKFKFQQGTTDASLVLKNKKIDTVVIATPHSSHAKLVVSALKFGKNVFVEKPLAITLKEVGQIRKAAKKTSLMVGFNRRFSGAVQKCKSIFTTGGPLAMHYRVHAGQIKGDHWVFAAGEGGRFLGEVGHFLDVFAYLTDAPAVQVQGAIVQPGGDRVVVITYADGSVGTLHYLFQGASKTPKEYLEIMGQGKTVQMDNFRKVTVLNGARRAVYTYKGDKGQREMLNAFVAALKAGQPSPISLESLLNTTRATILAQVAAQESTILQV